MAHPEEIAAAIRDATATVEALSDIAQVAVFRYATDASSALRNGCVLLSVAPANPEENGDGFIYLVGLPRGVKVNAHLSIKFQD